ncbi:methylated-DNA--[protein]-cysteine S-methyltransferase [Kiloniella antarctica]|uniref:Methylated-DNA--[protein]-cysteine S-methyltransferase n=1 Tax=Kiloniella antarctica TaxID=1550907 RepID=A0ABW5BP27_9PROT
MAEDSLLVSRHRSPIGEIVTFYRDGILCHLDFTDCQIRWEKLLRRRFPQLSLIDVSVNSEMEERLMAYFAKETTAFTGVKLDTGGTDFQKEVWDALCKIPFGTTETYSSMATKIGKPKAIRAMAAANALNPISLIIPCHRIIGKDGSLTGYGGGLERKGKLLEHEKR